MKRTSTRCNVSRHHGHPGAKFSGRPVTNPLPNVEQLFHIRPPKRPKLKILALALVLLAASALLHFVTTLLVCQEALPLEAIGALACHRSDQHLKSR
jgi:hypothetical protein